MGAKGRPGYPGGDCQGRMYRLAAPGADAA